jgi:Enoyl-CoA hydratase/carnithine racemase
MELIQYELNEHVGVITINRPKALNALNTQVIKELDETLDVTV